MVSRSLAALLALSVLLLAAPVATGAAAGPVGSGATAISDTQAVSDSDAVSDSRAQVTQQLAEPDVVFGITLEADGDARWRVSATVPLRDANETAGFENLAEEFESGEASPLGLDSLRAASNEASAVTGRSMRIEDENRTAVIDNETGTLVLTFRWTNFARTEDGALYVGDAFNTTTGTWLPELTDRQTLTIEPPAGYDVRSAPVGVVDGVARWEGPREFDGRDPWIVYAGEGTNPGGPGSPSTATDSAPNTTATGTPGSATNGTSPPVGPDSSPLPLVGFVFLVGAVALAAYVFRDGSGIPDAVTGVGGDGTDDAPAADPPAETDGAAADSSAGGAAAADADADDEAEDEDDVDVELLSDEERVERLLDRNGGRMKQADIVKETGWSNAKVSQLLSSMEEEGRIDKLRIGRENLISFPDEDVTDFESD